MSDVSYANSFCLQQMLLKKTCCRYTFSIYTMLRTSRHLYSENNCCEIVTRENVAHQAYETCCNRVTRLITCCRYIYGSIKCCQPGIFSRDNVAYWISSREHVAYDTFGIRNMLHVEEIFVSKRKCCGKMMCKMLRTHILYIANVASR